MRFILTCRVELNQEETALVEKYKTWDYVVHSFETIDGSKAIWTIEDLVKRGRSVACDGVVTLLQYEEDIKNACKNLKTLLLVMASFGGTEVFEY
ncbi:MAG: hypothetical protein ABIK56_02085 [candidate division WOR-3 bacterium]